MAIQEQSQQEQKQEPESDGNRQPENEGNQKRADPRKKRRVRFIVLAVLVIAAVSAIPIFAYFSVRESTDDAQVDGHVAPVSPRIAGTIVNVLVDDNQPVRRGQELVKLDPADFEVALQQARANVATAEASTTESQVNVPLTTINTRGSFRSSSTVIDQNKAALTAAERGVEAATAALNSSRATQAEKEANLLKAEKDLARYKVLVDKDEISKQEYDGAEAAKDANRAQVESAIADVRQAQHTLEQSTAQIAQARARLAQSVIEARQSEEVIPKQLALSQARYRQSQAQAERNRADLSQAQLNLSYAVIKAPIDGLVSRKSAEPGMQTSVGQQIMSIIPLDDIWITANFKETQIKQMAVGQKVEIKVDTFGGRIYRGHIDSIAAASGARFSLLPPENATGNYVKVVQRVPVKIVLDEGENRDHRLRPGMSVVPTVLLNTPQPS